ncbi:unnamed protein product [Taenia asiatica]|uniref:Uncharacterized protein n=1 Tax=Taenia asiatica TaxID=60517 RepID=A0A0R3WGY8_TAEAS|nr:unnamed protein product [Taenia asiatica]
MCKAEFAGDAKPRVVLPSPVGGPCEQNIAIESFHKSVCLSVVVVEEEASAIVTVVIGNAILCLDSVLFPVLTPSLFHSYLLLLACLIPDSF